MEMVGAGHVRPYGTGIPMPLYGPARSVIQIRMGNVLTKPSLQVTGLAVRPEERSWARQSHASTAQKTT